NFADNALEESTKAKYASQWKGYEAYCKASGLLTSEPMSVVSYIEHRTTEGLAFGTIRGDVDAISDRFRHERVNPAINSYVKAALKAAGKKAPAVKHRSPLLRKHIIE